MNSIRLELSNWLYNAGIVGLANILEHSNDDFIIDGNTITINENVLDNFEEKYFSYLIDIYEKNSSWYYVIKFESFIRKHTTNELKEFTQEDLDILNNYIINLKKIINKSSMISAYKLIHNQMKVTEIGKEITKVKLNDEIKETFENIMLIINYFKEPQSKKYIAAKNIIYNIIKNAWNGVSFLNPKTKIHDVYLDYKAFFVDNTINYMKSNPEKYKYNCFICDRKTKNNKNTLTFMKMGFDVAKKPSHIWNFDNDVCLCDICKLVYSCVPAGFAYVHDNGFYINESQDIKRAKDINNQVKFDCLNNDKTNIFRDIMKIFSSNKYELADVQVIEYINGNYKFNMFSAKHLQFIKESQTELDSLANINIVQNGVYYKVYYKILDNILHNKNHYDLIHKMLVIKMSKPNDAKYGNHQIMKIITINQRYLKGIINMDTVTQEYLKNINSIGFCMKLSYKKKNSENKTNQIAYMLLNALNTNDKTQFVDTLIRCYVYLGEIVPKFVTEILISDSFKIIGYGFVSGLITDNKKKENVENG